jgi:hypothetical protein
MTTHYRPHNIGNDISRPVAQPRNDKQWITPMALKARFNLSQFELDEIVNAAAGHPIVWRQGQLELGLALACVKKIKGLS